MALPEKNVSRQKTFSEGQSRNNGPTDSMARAQLVEEGLVKASGQIDHLNEKIRLLNEARMRELEELEQRRLLIAQAMERGNIRRNKNTGKYRLVDEVTGRVFIFSNSLEDEKVSIEAQKLKLEMQMHLPMHPRRNATQRAGHDKEWCPPSPLLETSQATLEHGPTVNWTRKPSKRLDDSSEPASQSVPPTSTPPDRTPKVSLEEGGSAPPIVDEGLEAFDDAGKILWSAASCDEMKKLLISPKATTKLNKFLLSSASPDQSVYWYPHDAAATLRHISPPSSAAALAAMQGIPAYAFVKYNEGEFKPLSVHLAVNRGSVIISRKKKYNKLDPSKFNLLDISSHNLDFLFERKTEKSNNALSVAYNYYPVVLLVNDGRDGILMKNDDLRSVILIFRFDEDRQQFCDVYQFIALKGKHSLIIRSGEGYCCTHECPSLANEDGRQSEESESTKSRSSEHSPHDGSKELSTSSEVILEPNINE
eukprot:GHVH01017379.1.p1 GENE.GHVH01017379.1~~GHVH01017379.1.p1  ORF type:complete len:479 (+),score=57.19 GHVH01017379.1:91-1527(+)